VYVDKLSLTQAYDMWVFTKVYPNEDKWTTIIDTYSTTGWLLNKRGETNQWAFLVSDGFIGGSSLSPTSTLNNNVWRILGMLINKTSYLSAYENGLNFGNQDMSLKGKIFTNKAMTIGGTSLFFKGLISHIQILRFTNIGQSNFDPTTYKIGQSVSGGGAESVLLLDFGKDKTSMTNILKDWSGTGNNVTGVNVDSSNVIRKI